MHSTKRVLVIIADGTEEMEAVTSIDVLRRAGFEVRVAGLQSDELITCSRGVKLAPDFGLTESVLHQDLEAIVLPGGLKGANAFASHSLLQLILKKLHSNGHTWICAICAGPIALEAAGIAHKTNATLTSHPSVQSKLEHSYNYVQDRVAIDNNHRLITSRGPGTALEFSLAIVETLASKELRDHVAAPMVISGIP